MEQEEIIDIIESLRKCREFEQRNNLKLFTKKYKKIMKDLESKLERKKKVNIEDRVDNLEEKLNKIDKKLDQQRGKDEN